MSRRKLPPISFQRPSVITLLVLNIITGLFLSIFTCLFIIFETKSKHSKKIQNLRPLIPKSHSNSNQFEIFMIDILYRAKNKNDS